MIKFLQKFGNKIVTDFIRYVALYVTIYYRKEAIINKSYTNSLKILQCTYVELISHAYIFLLNSVSLHHPVGTARMGRADDPLAVVDTRLRVRGIKGLRVVDSSIQPVIIVTNSGASAMMIGDKGAEMILQDWAQVKVKEAKNRQEERLDAGKSNGISENEEDLDFNRLKRKRRLD